MQKEKSSLIASKLLNERQRPNESMKATNEMFDVRWAMFDVAVTACCNVFFFR